MSDGKQDYLQNLAKLIKFYKDNGQMLIKISPPMMMSIQKFADMLHSLVPVFELDGYSDDLMRFNSSVDIVIDSLHEFAPQIRSDHVQSEGSDDKDDEEQSQSNGQDSNSNPHNKAVKRSGAPESAVKKILRIIQDTIKDLDEFKKRIPAQIFKKFRVPPLKLSYAPGKNKKATKKEHSDSEEESQAKKEGQGGDTELGEIIKSIEKDLDGIEQESPGKGISVRSGGRKKIREEVEKLEKIRRSLPPAPRPVFLITAQDSYWESILKNVSRNSSWLSGKLKSGKSKSTKELIEYLLKFMIGSKYLVELTALMDKLFKLFEEVLVKLKKFYQFKKALCQASQSMKWLGLVEIDESEIDKEESHKAESNENEAADTQNVEEEIRSIFEAESEGCEEVEVSGEELLIKAREGFVKIQALLSIYHKKSKFRKKYEKKITVLEKRFLVRKKNFFMFFSLTDTTITYKNDKGVCTLVKRLRVLRILVIQLININDCWIMCKKYSGEYYSQLLGAIKSKKVQMVQIKEILDEIKEALQTFRELKPIMEKFFGKTNPIFKLIQNKLKPKYEELEESVDDCQINLDAWYQVAEIYRVQCVYQDFNEQLTKNMAGIKVKITSFIRYLSFFVLRISGLNSLETVIQTTSSTVTFARNTLTFFRILDVSKTYPPFYTPDPGYFDPENWGRIVTLVTGTIHYEIFEEVFAVQKSATMQQVVQDIKAYQDFANQTNKERRKLVACTKKIKKAKISTIHAVCSNAVTIFRFTTLLASFALGYLAPPGTSLSSLTNVSQMAMNIMPQTVGGDA